MPNEISQFIYTLFIYIQNISGASGCWIPHKREWKELMPEFIVTFGTACNSCSTLRVWHPKTPAKVHPAKIVEKGPELTYGYPAQFYLLRCTRHICIFRAQEELGFYFYFIFINAKNVISTICNCSGPLGQHDSQPKKKHCEVENCKNLEKAKEQNSFITRWLGKSHIFLNLKSVCLSLLNLRFQWVS